MQIMETPTDNKSRRLSQWPIGLRSPTSAGRLIHRPSPSHTSINNHFFRASLRQLSLSTKSCIYIAFRHGPNGSTDSSSQAPYESSADWLYAGNLTASPPRGCDSSYHGSFGTECTVLTAISWRSPSFMYLT